MEMWFVHCEYPAGIVGITAREELPLQIMCLIYWSNRFFSPRYLVNRDIKMSRKKKSGTIGSLN